MEGFARGPRPLLAQLRPSVHSSLSEEGRDNPLANGRSVSLVDLQDAQSPPRLEAPPRLSRAGSQASVGHAHSTPLTPHPAKAPPRDGQPQSAPQVRRPLPAALSQQRSLQPLSFQNPVYHLSNPAPSPPHDSSSENLSTESSHNSRSNSDDYGSQVGVKGRAASTSSLDELGSSSSTPRRHLPAGAATATATAVAIPRQSTTAGTAHIVKVEQQSRGGGGARTPRSLPHSASLRSSSSANTEPTPTGHAPRQPCSAENVAPPPRSGAKQPQQVRLKHTCTAWWAGL